MQANNLTVFSLYNDKSQCQQIQPCVNDEFPVRSHIIRYYKRKFLKLSGLSKSEVFFSGVRFTRCFRYVKYLRQRETHKYRSETHKYRYSDNQMMIGRSQIECKAAYYSHPITQLPTRTLYLASQERIDRRMGHFHATCIKNRVIMTLLLEHRPPLFMRLGKPLNIHTSRKSIKSCFEGFVARL